MAGLLVAGCSAGPAPEDSERTPAPLVTEPDHGHDDEPPTPVLDGTAEARAVATAVAALTAFTADPADQDQWWPALAPSLTAEAAAEHAHTDPAEVPPLTLGAARIVSIWATLALVQIDTDAGPAAVWVTRNAHAPEWAADRIMLPDDPATLGDTHP